MFGHMTKFAQIGPTVWTVEHHTDYRQELQKPHVGLKEFQNFHKI